MRDRSGATVRPRQRFGRCCTRPGMCCLSGSHPQVFCNRIGRCVKPIRVSVTSIVNQLFGSIERALSVEELRQEPLNCTANAEFW